MKRILLVDDDRDILELFTAVLEATNRYTVLSCTLPAEAVSLLDRSRPDLLITDLRMPEMGGIELLSHALRKYPLMPTALTSAYVSGPVEHVLKRWGTTIIAKPVNLARFQRVVAELTGERSWQRRTSVVDRDACMELA